MRRLVIAALLASCAPPPPVQEPGPPDADPDFGAVHDPINTIDMTALHRKSQRILGELVEGLQYEFQQTAVEGVRLSFAEDGINAYAGCDGATPRIAVTDDLLKAMAYLARTRATEEIFGVDATRAYMDWVGAHHGELDPPSGRENLARSLDRKKLARQHELFDEGIAWVLGHELAHHYLNHLTCGRDGGIVADVRREAQEVIPAFHQPDEIAADASGIANTLRAGQHRKGYSWTHRGGLLLLEFFAHEHSIGVPDIVFAFAITHPPAQVRIPLLKADVASWYLSNGTLPAPIPVPELPLADTK